MQRKRGGARLRKYVADQGDTLRMISRRRLIELDRLVAVNPHIAQPDANLQGQIVNLPPDDLSTSGRQFVAPFCPALPESQLIRSWIPVTGAEQMAASGEYDVIVIGTGAGGGAALWRLCDQWGNNGKRIGVIERGPLFLQTHVANIATINYTTFRAYYPPEITYLLGNKLPQLPGSKLVYGFGGRTLLWGLVSPRMPDCELADWPVDIDEMRFYYKIAEKVMNVTTDYTKDSSATRIPLERLWASGFPEATDIPIAARLEPSEFGKVRSNVFFSSILFFARALARRPYDLAVNTPAVRVVIDGNKVVGVKVMTADKKEHLIKAKNVVVAASTLQTTRLLLHSRIPGRTIGHYFNIQSYLIANPVISTKGFPDELGTLGILVPQSADRPYQLQLQGLEQYFHYHFEEKPRKDEWSVDYFVSGMVESRFENRVYLDPIRRDEYGVPEIQVSFSYSAKDEEIIGRMHTAMRQAAAAMQMRLVSREGAPPVCMMPPGTDNHESGTCRMGDDPHTSATDRYGQIHGISGLYCADGSVLPTTGATNPTLSIAALAIRTADHIIRQSQSG
jgi:choline dehydrogenase-like flavoprotein